MSPIVQFVGGCFLLGCGLGMTGFLGLGFSIIGIVWAFLGAYRFLLDTRA